jgi:hypothetical protein
MKQLERHDIETQDFINRYEQMIVEVSPGITVNQREIINESYRLLHAQFATNPIEADGFVNVFTRKMWVVYRTLIQGGDIDTKDAKITSTIVAKQFVLDILKMVFHSHMHRTFFGEKIDEFKEQMAWFGSYLIKRYNGEIGVVDWRNYITEPHIKDTQCRRHAEMWFSSFDKIQQYKDEWANWDDIETLWERMQKEGESQFSIIDFWTWDKDGKKICKRSLDNTLMRPEEGHNTSEWFPSIFVDEFKTPYKIKCETKREQKIYGEYREMFPYEQEDLYSIPGRVLGLGCGELLAHPEMMYDQLFNTKRKMDLKALFGILVHKSARDKDGKYTALSQESITNIDKGTIISLIPGEELNQFPFDTRSSDFAQMEEKIYELMLQLVGITAQGTGQTVAASTSATQIQDNRLTENKVYQHFKQRMHHGLTRLMQNGYMQDMLEDLTENELINIVGDPRQLKEIDGILIDNAINDWVVKTKEATGMYPAEEEIMMVRQSIEQDLSQLGTTRFPSIKKELTSKLNFFIEWNFVDESIDMKQKMDTLNAIKNDQASSKSKAKIEDELLSMAGLNPMQYAKTEEELALEEQAKQQEMLANQGLNTPVA